MQERVLAKPLRVAASRLAGKRRERRADGTKACPAWARRSIFGEAGEAWGPAAIARTRTTDLTIMRSLPSTRTAPDAVRLRAERYWLNPVARTEPESPTSAVLWAQASSVPATGSKPGPIPEDRRR